MATTFWGVCNGGFGQVADGELNNVTPSLTINLKDVGTGTRFAEATFPFLVTIHDGDLPASYPHLDANMEIAVVESFPDTDQMELTRPNPKPHTGEPHIQLMVMKEHVKQLQDAVNAIEQVHRVFGEVLGGLKNGSNLVFTFGNDFDAETERINFSGLILTRGDDYTVTGPAEITLVTDFPPTSADNLTGDYEWTESP
jgi:hypothetical protein